MISLDTDLLQQLAEMMKRADTQINEAVELLERTAEHNDWCCRERLTINENTRKNKRTAEQLGRTSQSFSASLMAAAMEFAAKEKAISSMMGDTEMAVGSVLAGKIGSILNNAHIHTGQNHPLDPFLIAEKMQRIFERFLEDNPAWWDRIPEGFSVVDTTKEILQVPLSRLNMDL